MISRHWKGIARREDAERYLAHLKTDTFPRLASLAGFLQATILRREIAEGTEFQVVTVWESVDAIHAFAGDDAEAAVVPPAAQGMMMDFDRRAVHYEVVYAFDAADRRS